MKKNDNGLNEEKAEKKPRNFKKFKYGSMSMIVVVLVVAIVVVLNIVISLLMKRYPIKADLTADKRYELCDESIDALKNMTDKVEITVTYPKETLMQYQYYQMLPELLDKYSVYANSGNGSIDINYVNLTKDPDVVSKFSDYYNGNITEGSIVIFNKEKEKVKVISIYSLFQSPSQSYYSTDNSVTFTGESALTSAILSVTDANPVNAAFASLINQAYVYGEDSGSYYSTNQFKSLLASNGYECSDIDVMTDEINPEEIDLLVIPAPSVDFSEDVIAKFEDFLYNNGSYGKHIIYISNLYAMELPNLEEFLAKWNIQVEDAVILDDTNMIKSTISSLGGTTPAPVASIADADAVGELPNESLPVAVPFAREITVLDKNSEYVTSPLLVSSDTSYITYLSDDQQASDEKKSRNIAVLSRRERSEGMDVLTSSVLVFGSAFISDPSLITNTSAYNNANVLLNTVNTMTGKENGVVIPQKNLQVQTLALTAKQGKLLGTLVIYIIPLIVVVIGFAVFMRRRNR